MLGWAFFILPIALFWFSGLVCAFSCGILVTCGFLVTYECFFMCSVNHLYIFTLTITHTSLQGSVTVHSGAVSSLCSSHPWGGMALLWDCAVTWTSRGVWLCTSPLQSYADTFYLFGHPAIYIARTEPQAPIKMVTLTIYCLKDKLGILCACGNYPQAAEGL